jgi:tight adherence protein C
MLWIGMLSIGLAVGLGLYLMMGTAVTADGLAADQIAEQQGTSASRRERDRTDEDLSSLYKRFGALAKRFTPSDYLHRVQHKLDLAGNPRNWGPDRLLAFKGFGLLIGGLLGLLIGAKQGGLLLFAAPAGGAAAGLFLPDVWVRNLGEKRQVDLQKGLPDAMDMLTICVEAGLGFDAAIGRVARNLDGPIAEECSRVLQEMQFGMSRSEAMRSLVSRTDVPELRSFVSAVIQSTELGISIGDVLREQSKEMRIKRRQRAEEKAQKLQVKLLLPLITCLLPAMFTVVLGPAAIELIHFFKQTKGG